MVSSGEPPVVDYIGNRCIVGELRIQKNKKIIKKTRLSPRNRKVASSSLAKELAAERHLFHYLLHSPPPQQAAAVPAESPPLGTLLHSTN